MVFAAKRIASLSIAGVAITLSAASVCLSQGRVDAAGDPLPKSALLRLGSLRFSTPDGVMELILSQDEKTLVSFGRFIIGWDAHSGRELWRRTSPLGYLPACYGNRAVTIAADGEHFLLADHTAGCLTKWDMRSGETTETRFPFAVGAEGITGAARAIDVSTGGHLTFVGSGAGYQVLDAASQAVYEQREAFPAVERDRDRLTFGGGYCYARFSPDGSRLALVTSKNPMQIQLLNAATGEKVGDLACTDNAVRMEFSPDGKQLAVTERDTAVRLYDCLQQKQVWQCVFEVDKRSENYTSALAFSPNGEYLVVCERNETLFKVATATGKLVGSIRNHSWNPWTVAFTQDGKTFFSSGWGGTIHQWDADSLGAIPLPKGYRGTSAVTLSNNGKFCASVDQAGQIHVVDCPAGTPVSILHVPSGSFEVVEFSRDSMTLAAGGSWGGEVHVIEWDLETSQIIHHWHWDIGADPVTGVEDIVFSRDDQRMVVSIFRQDAAYLIDRDSNERVKLPHRRVYGATFSAAGDEIFSVGWDKMLRVWNGTTGEQVIEQLLPSDMADTRMYTVCADPTGKWLATCTLNESIGLYDADTKELIREWDVGASFVYGALRFSPDGLWLASGNAGGDIVVWDPTTGERLHRIDAHDDHVYTIDFGKDNCTICSGGSNVGYVWSLRPSMLDCESSEDALTKLMGDKASDAYQAWWYMLEQGDETVATLLRLCDKVRTIYDIEAMVRKSTESQRDRRRQMLFRATAGQPDAISLTSAQRIISVISHVDTLSAKQALIKLSERDDELGQLARLELARKEPQRSWMGN